MGNVNAKKVLVVKNVILVSRVIIIQALDV